LEDRANMTRSVNNGDNISVKRQQRRGFLVGLIVAAVPILCQVLMLLALWAAPEAFPAADRTFTQGRFWPIQVVLLCVAVAGTAIVDCMKLMLTERRIEDAVLAYFLPLLLCLFVESMMFSVTLLASRIGWSWLAGMTVIGVFTLLLAFMSEMEIAGKA
jgi:hypothetical protein